MPKIAIISLFLITVFTSITSSATELTEEAIVNFLDKIEDSINNRDVAAIANSMSDNVTIFFNVNIQGQTQALSPSKKEHIALLEHGMSQLSNYTYQKSNVKINIIEKIAFITLNTNETMTIRGQDFSSFSEEKITIEIEDGVLLITKIETETSFQSL